MTGLGFVLAALIGLTLGLLGGGGSILTVPIFVYVLGFGAKEAIAASLAVVGTASLFGAAGHWRAGNIRVRLALGFGLFAMTGAFLGSRYLAPLFSGAAQLTVFAGVMLLAAASMFRGRAEVSEASRGATGAALPLTSAAGFAVGVLTGLVGVGGGFLIVPALVVLRKVPMKQAVGTSLLVIAMNSAAGLAGYLGRVPIAWGFLALFTTVAVAGIFAGTYLVHFVTQAQLRRAFAVFLVGMGAFILYQNRRVVLASGETRAEHIPANDINQPRNARTKP